MEEYKIETIIAGLLGGLAILWHQLIKQFGINRADQKEFSALMSRNMEIVSRCEKTLERMEKRLDNEQV